MTVTSSSTPNATNGSVSNKDAINGNDPVESTTAAKPTTPTHEDDASAMSEITDDNASVISRASASVSSVLSQSLRILTGHDPNGSESEEEEEARPGLNGIKSVSFGTIPMEATNEDDNNDDDEPVIDFLKDDPKEMTYARRIALALMDKKWYNPRAGEDVQEEVKQQEAKIIANEEAEGDYKSKYTQVQYPSLARAWAYFEHVTLPRYIFHPKPHAPKKNLAVRVVRKMSKANKTLDRAEPGENHLPTKLYSPIFTPLKQMGDFGLGIGLYFSTLRALTILTLLAGLLNIPNFLYFSSDEYSLGQAGIKSLLKGSAICTNQVWVPCPECNVTDFEDNPDRIASTNIVDDFGNNVTLTFALKNDCDGATLEQGMINYGTLLLILVGIVVMNQYQKYMEVKYDEDEQTAQDYSIVITNPPPDATNPEEWRAFFKDNFDNAQVTACTVAVDNDLLVRSLLERRECMRKIEMLVEPGTSMDTLNIARIAAKIERERSFFASVMAKIVPGIPELFGRATVLTARVQGLAQQDYPASHVFCTFEREADQRRVLSALSVGSIAANRNKTRVMKDTPQYLFRGKTLLNVQEPDEPSTVRWQDLNAKMPQKMKTVITTTIATIAAIALIALLIRVLQGISAAWAAIAIAVSNSVFPEFAKILTSIEPHASEGGKQTSLYFKIAVFRWVNTAIIITIITPFTKTIDYEEGLINSIYAIFFAEIVTTNAIQLLDPMGHIQRHLLAPRAATQDLMNLKMQGQVFELAERYTNMTKILFLAVWYCSIYPGALFMCSFALFINYFTDRFSLMRTWKRAPALGTRISKFSRRYFFSTAIVAMAIVSSYYWSGFPFDNLCDVEEYQVGSAYDGTWVISTLGSGTRYTTTVDLGETAWKFCLQDLLRTSGRSFPALPEFQPEGSEWMTEEQEKVTTVYGWTSVAVLVVVALSFIWGWYSSARGLFRGTYSPNGEDQGINFSDVPSISTYVPQVVSTVFSYPLLACSTDGIDEELLDWTDPDKPHSYYDLTKDADEVLRGMDMSDSMVFSTLTHWPPERKKNNRSKSQAP